MKILIPVTIGIMRAHDRENRGNGVRRRANRRLKENRGLRELVEEWTGGATISIGAKMVGTKGIGDHEHDICVGDQFRLGGAGKK
jgi:hypothetical protein